MVGAGGGYRKHSQDPLIISPPKAPSISTSPPPPRYVSAVAVLLFVRMEPVPDADAAALGSN